LAYGMYEDASQHYMLLPVWESGLRIFQGWNLYDMIVNDLAV
jgi:hypothetical protein